MYNLFPNCDNQKDEKSLKKDFKKYRSKWLRLGRSFGTAICNNGDMQLCSFFVRKGPKVCHPFGGSTN